MSSNGEEKRASALTVADLTRTPVWKYTGENQDGDPLVRPVLRLPTRSLAGKIVGTRVRLASQSEVWALLGNVDAQDRRLNQHFLTISFERDGRWFHLARYHDHDYGERGPEQLAQFLGVAGGAIFPIAYDLRPFAVGSPNALAGIVTVDPVERLTRAQIIALAVS